jgi:DNA-binding CsgD family transcriptional regulator
LVDPETGSDSTIGQHHRLDALERAIVVRVAQGARDRDIAQQFGISVDSAKRRVRILMERTGAQNRAELAARSILEGWIGEVDLDFPPRRGG